MTTEPEVRLSVILPTRNGRRHIEDQLGALERQRWDHPWEVVFLNNGSDDGTRELLETWLLRMPVHTLLVDADDHHSLAYARNAGVSAATGRSVAFVDDDDVIDDRWVAAMGTSLEQHAFVGSSFEYALLNDPVVAAARGSFQTAELGQFLGAHIASGGGSGCLRSLWQGLGGNDLTFYRSGEDIDFSLRMLLQAGTEPTLCREAVYHVRLRGGARASYQQAHRYAASSVALFRLHGPALGARPEPIHRIVRRWLGLALRSVRLYDAQSRLRWMWQLGYRVGRLTGSVRERTWYP